MNKSAAAVPSAEQNALAEEIDRRVAQRTAELTAANEQLRKALAEIQQSEAKLRQMIDAIPAMAWSAHPDGSGEFFNQHYLDYVGLPADLELGISEITVKAHRGKMMQKMKADSVADLVKTAVKLALAPAKNPWHTNNR